VTDLNSVDFATIEPAQFTQIVKGASNSDIAALLEGEHRKTVLDGIFAKMPTLFRPEKAGSTQAVIHWIITGGPNGSDTYELVIADGTCTQTDKPEHEPRLAVTVGPVDFIKLVSGNGNPMMMFMTGKLKAKGDIGLAAKIADLFNIPKG
jgi:hypothetical protein